MDLFTRADLKDLLQTHEPPCVSLFLPAHRGGKEADPILFRKHLTTAHERLLAAGFRAAQVQDVLAPAGRLLEDGTFWKNQGDGLALFCSAQFFRVFRLPVPLESLVVVGSRFHLKPLLPLLAGDGRFFVLALSQNGVRLLEGTRFQVTEVDLRGAPRNLAEALITHDRDEVLSFHARPSAGGGSWGAIFHGQGVGIDDKKDDLVRYFQKIDRALTPLLHQEHAPLMLAAVDFLQPLYRQANTYPHLLEIGIHGNPDRIRNQELHVRAWSFVAPLFQADVAKAKAQLEHVAGTEHGGVGLEKVLPEAYEGRVETLFVAADRQVWGIFDPNRKQAERHPEARFDNVDLLNLAAGLTLAHGHKVYVLPAAQIPGHEIAAIYRLPPPKHEGKRP
jgi:hypothetical protein